MEDRLAELAAVVLTGRDVYACASTDVSDNKEALMRGEYVRLTRRMGLIASTCLSTLAMAQGSAPPPFKDASLPAEQRVHDLISRMTLEEKAAQLGHTAPAIPRLGVPEYNWW